MEPPIQYLEAVGHIMRGSLGHPLYLDHAGLPEPSFLLDHEFHLLLR